MYAFYEDFEALDRKYGSNKETLHFLDSYHENIAELLSALKMIDALNLLILYDHEHKELYESYLKN